MNYIAFLRQVHRKVKPKTYFEIGCREGRSLSVSNAPVNIGVDPDYQIKWQIESPVRLYKMTSDDFFATKASVILKGGFDLCFIDGMHLAEYALRDFINCEKFARPGSVVIIDDILPENMEIASRTRTTARWTGDVYKLISVLKFARPDLQIDIADVAVKGAMVIRNLDPKNGVLEAALPRLVDDLKQTDVPDISAEELRDIAKPVKPENVLLKL